MEPRLQLKTLAQITAIFLLAYALKSFYSTASVNDLRWVLAPTAFFVEIITGEQFIFESQAGYMSTDRTFLIAASCSGVNFLIISFLMLALGKLWRKWPRDIEWQFLLFAPFVAYVATLVANTTRIVISLASRGLEIDWFDREEIHRIEGVVVYFGFLLLLFAASERLAESGADIWGLIRLVALRAKYLLAIYYTVTIGIPLARGSYHEGSFWQHSIVVVLVPLILVLPFTVVYLVKNKRRRTSPYDLELP